MAEVLAVMRRPFDPAEEAALLRAYGFSVPTAEAVMTIARHSPKGVLELGAGVGYWAHQLRLLGVDVVAYDIEPPPSRRNQWFAGQQPWHQVRRGDQRVACDHTQRSLMIIWPTKNETWAADAVADYHRAGGTTVLYVGERPGGCTGDPFFHARLGETGRCISCAYGVVDIPCTCAADRLWQCIDELALPAWQGDDPRLLVYERFHTGRRRGRGASPGFRRWARWFTTSHTVWDSRCFSC